MRYYMRIRVLVQHSDEIIEAGLVAALGCMQDLEVFCLPQGMAAQPGTPEVPQCDVLIADYERGMQALELTAAQPRSAPGRKPARVLIFTSRDRHAEVRDALAHGVQGYVLQGCSAWDLGNAVRRIAQGMRYLSEAAAMRMVEDAASKRLTQRESEVLQWVAEGCANKVIAARLGIELATVKVHMKAVLDKLGARNRTEAAAIANQRGLLRARGAVQSGDAEGQVAAEQEIDADRNAAERLPAVATTPEPFSSARL